MERGGLNSHALKVPPRLWVCALLVFVSACTVDTELGVAADFQSAALRVSGTGDSTVVAVDLVVDFRVGQHAQGGARSFVVTTASLFVESVPVADVRVDDSRSLSPGEHTTVTLSGVTRPGAFPGARAILCTGSPVVQVLIQWSEARVMDPTMMTVDMADFTTTSITCE